MENNVVSSKHIDLNDEDIDLIERLVDALDKSSLDSLSLRTLSFSLQVGKSPAPRSPIAAIERDPGPVLAPQGVGMTAEATASAHNEGLFSVKPQDQTGKASVSHVDDGQSREELAKIVAPCVGKFYTRPDPSSEEYVKVGTCVSSDMTIGLIEVMKLFSAVEAGVDGEIVEICVSNGDLVQNGTVLMYVR